MLISCSFLIKILKLPNTPACQWNEKKTNKKEWNGMKKKNSIESLETAAVTQNTALLGSERASEKLRDRLGKQRRSHGTMEKEEGMIVFVCVCVCLCVRACVRECVQPCVRACVR